MKILLSILAGMSLMFATAARADPPFEWVKDNIDAKGEDGTLARFYVMGVYDGLSWANAELARRKEKLLFCQPPKVALSFDEVIAIFSKFAKNWKGEQDVPAGIIVMLALEAEFPCD